MGPATRNEDWCSQGTRHGASRGVMLGDTRRADVLSWAGMFRALALGIAVSSLVAGGCTTVKVQDTSPPEYLAARRGDVLSTGRLSHSATNILFSRGIKREQCERDWELCIQQLLDRESSSPIESDVLASVAEIATAEAIAHDHSANPTDSPRITDLYLKAARYAYAYLFMGERSVAERALEERQTQVRDYYNFAAERVAQLLFKRAKRVSGTHIPRSQDVQAIESWIVTTRLMEVRPPRAATGLEEIVPASALEFQGLHNIYRRDGFGAELVAVWHVPDETSVSIEIGYHPATVLLGFDGETDRDVLKSRRAYIDIFDPYQRRVVRVHGSDVALAGNFTGPYGLWLARSGFQAQALRTLFGRGSALGHAEVLMMQPYDPSRLTIVLIHGLASSPEAWVNVVNEILGDERLRGRYQVWQVYYPTNVPVAITQLDVRRALEQTFAAVDPERRNNASRNVVLIGHSMGGVIARLLVSTGGEKVWEERYHAPPGSERRKRLARLEAYLDFHPLAGVNRVIFLASPHAGTPAARTWLGRRIASLVHLPSDLAARVDTTADSIANDLPEAARTLRSHPNAINLLDSKSPFGQIVQKLSIASEIHYHSIIARKNANGEVEKSTDGFVPYSSAFLPGADSTLVIQSGHHVQETNAAILEIRRILLLHSAAHPEQPESFVPPPRTDAGPDFEQCKRADVSSCGDACLTRGPATNAVNLLPGISRESRSHWPMRIMGGSPCGARHPWPPPRRFSLARERRCMCRTTPTSGASERSVRIRHGAFLPLGGARSEWERPGCRVLVREAAS